MSHRLPLAVAARDAGYEVVVATRVSSHLAAMEASGLRVVPLKHLKRSSANLISELKCLAEIFGIVRKERPNILHAVAIKPVIYAALCGRILKMPRMVAALGGLGSIFSGTGPKAQTFRPIVKVLFRVLLSKANTRVILQNTHDMDLLARECGLRQKNLVLIRGAGVDTEQFSEKPLPDGVPIVMLAARMIWPKGIQEFVDAAVVLKKKMDVRFVLVGRPDVENAASVPEALLRRWNEEGNVEWWGHQVDMADTLGRATLVCLPTYYGEGVPKILLEAMSLGRPIITTDTPGCKELVEDGRGGMLVEQRSAVSLANAIEALLFRRDHLSALAHEARKLVLAEYGVHRVIDQTLRAYQGGR